MENTEQNAKEWLKTRNLMDVDHSRRGSVKEPTHEIMADYASQVTNDSIKVDKYGNELSEPTEDFYTRNGKLDKTFLRLANKQYNQLPTRSEFIKSLLEKQESDKEKVEAYEQNETAIRECNKISINWWKAKVKELEGEAVRLKQCHVSDFERIKEYVEQLTQAKKDIDELREGNNKLYILLAFRFLSVDI